MPDPELSSSDATGLAAQAFRGRGLGAAPGPDVGAVLGVVEQLGAVSLELLAWELAVPKDRLRDRWERCVQRGLIAPARVDLFGERTYRLTEAGAARLIHLRAAAGKRPAR